jgi:Domain of unknown function (DUF4062)
VAIQVKKVRIFVASPGDVHSERDQLFKVINELNLTISALAPEKGIVLELVRWETHVHPGIGADPQKVINLQIDDYDIFVGVMWKRMGTPTTTSQSGTEEEFQRAYEKWREDNSFPVLFYFCQQAFAPPRTQEEVEQMGKVAAFRDDLTKKGFLVGDYTAHEEFSDVVRPHLLLLLGKMFSSKGTTVDAAQRAGEHTAKADVSAVRAQVLALAKEYEETRRSMRAGDSRTRAMEVVASRMRSLALPAYPLLSELTASGSTGQRLAAISILEAIPTPEYLAWLADRLSTEKPFLGYHSSVALLQAARNLRATNTDDVKNAITRAWQSLRQSEFDDPNQIQILKQAEEEVNWTPAKSTHARRRGKKS